MNILIIEDDPIKLKSLKEFIESYSEEIQIEFKMSYQSGLLEIFKNNYSLILLDMQLPNYDIKSGEDGYKPRPVAGRDILREIKRKNINTTVLIMTQYEGFGENGKFESLEQWDIKLSEEFKNIYSQTIQYKPGSSSWKDLFTNFLNKNYR